MGCIINNILLYSKKIYTKILDKNKIALIKYKN